MKLIIASALAAGGSFVAAEAVNPALNECLAVMDPQIERADATIIEPLGDPLAVEFVLECGAEGGDDLFTFRFEAEEDEVVVEAVVDVVTSGPPSGTPGAP